MSITATIRRASPGDARAIARVHVECWRSAYAGILPDRVMVDMSVEDKAVFWRRMVQRAGRRDAVLVASLADSASPRSQIVGFASCAAANAGPPDYDGEVQTLYVLPDWQEQGLGRALLCGAFQALKGAGFRAAFVWVLAQNPARFFYEAMGGRRIGERTEALWGAELPEVAYGWPDLEAALAGRGER